MNCFFQQELIGKIRPKKTTEFKLVYSKNQLIYRFIGSKPAYVLQIIIKTLTISQVFIKFATIFENFINLNEEVS